MTFPNYKYFYVFTISFFSVENNAINFSLHDELSEVSENNEWV